MSSSKKKKVVIDLNEIWSVEDVKRANERAGNYFYSQSTSKFFKSKPIGDIYCEVDVVGKKLKTVRAHFVDSAMSPMGRVYTPCFLTEDGNIERHRGHWLGTWRDSTSESPADFVRFNSAAQARKWIERWINTREYELAVYPVDAPMTTVTTVRLRVLPPAQWPDGKAYRAVTYAEVIYKDLKDVIREFSLTPRLPVTSKHYRCVGLKGRGGKDLVIVVAQRTGQHVIRLEAK